MKNQQLKSLVPVVLATGLLVGGCNSVRSWMSPDSGSSRSGQPTASEMAELCDMNQRMATMSRDRQDSMLESHMRSAHGSSTAEGMRAHREMMLQKCTR